MNGPGHHGQGLWKSLCGDASDDIATVFCGVMGRAPTDPELGHARWLLGAGASTRLDNIRKTPLLLPRFLLAARYGSAETRATPKPVKHKL